MFKRRSRRGFSIVELVLVVAIIGILASILMPHLIVAIHRAKQNRTMAELKSVGTAWMSWLTDQTGAASAGSAQVYNVQEFEPLTYAQIYGYLHPSETFFYMQDVPDVDGWGSPLTYYMNPNILSDNRILVCASARDGFFETCDGTNNIEIGPFVSTDFDQDVVWADGYLVRWPEALGAQ